MKKRILAITAALLIMSVTLYAATASELSQLFSDAIADGDIALAIDYYDELKEQSSKDMTNARRSYEKAIAAGSIQRAREARSKFIDASDYSISEEDSEALLSLILSENNDVAMEHASWLYRNSRYYNPSVTFEWNSSGDSFRYSFSHTVTVVPGTEITLPSAENVSADTSLVGVLIGWGITPDEVTYEAGETISSPLTSQTLYAIWETQVRFEDPVTGVVSVTEDIATGDSVEIPELTAPDDTYVFVGWVDESTGVYIASEETEYVLEGNGAVFKALWKNVGITDLEAKHYDITALPLNTQVELDFTVENNGTEDLRGLNVVVEGSDNLSILKDSGRISFIPDGQKLSMVGLRVVAKEAGDHTLTVTITDRDGDSWSQAFTVTAAE